METNIARYYEFGDFKLDSRRRILLKNGEKIPLSSRIFDLLLVMVQNEGRILEHNELLEMVWEGMFVEQSNLKKSVSALRQVLGEHANESLYIKTVPRRGYSFVAPVRAFSDEIETAIYRETETEVVLEEIIEIEDDEPIPTVNTKVLSAAPLQGFLRRIRKYQIVIAVFVVTFALVASFFVTKSYWSKLNFNYSVENVRAKRLTNEGNLGNSAPISPDGNYIVYPVYFGEQGSLWLKQVQTGSIARLTPVMSVQYWAYDFSPDGNYVYYIINHSGEPSETGLFRIPTLGGTPQRILERGNGGLTFAPDGSRFAFTRINEERTTTEVVTAKLDGSDLKRVFLVPENKNLWSLKWSPDNLSLLYSMRERGENKSVSYVAETRWDNPTDAPTDNIIVPRQDNQAIVSATWLPDKTALLLSIREPNADICQLWQYVPATGEKRRITNDDNSYRIINLTRDGKTFSTVQERWQSEAWVADSATLDFNPLGNTKSLGMILWTKNGNLIYEASENQQATIWTTDSEGNNKQPLTKGNDGIYLFPSISQDGNYFTFTSNRSGTNQIWRANFDGSNPQQLTDSKSTVNLRSKLLSDNQTLLFMTHTYQTGWILQKKSPSGEISPVTKNDTDFWSVSPDEKMLVVIVQDEKTKKYTTQVRNLETGDVLKTLELNVTRQLSWSRDGKALAYISPKPEMDELVLQPLDDSPPKVLSSSRGERIASFDWNFDGSKLVVVRSKYFADAFIIKAQ